MREILKSIYFALAPKGSWVYNLTHTTIRVLLNFRYQKWIKRYDCYDQQDLQRFHKISGSLPVRPLISVIMPVFNPDLKQLDQAIQSVKDQIYHYWELCIADDASTLPGVRDVLNKHSRDDPRIKVRYREINGHISAASNTALELASGAYVALLDHDDRLHPLALYYTVKEINEYPDSIVIFSDEDKLTPKGKRIDPYFKSDFDYDLFLSQNMVSHLGVYKREAILQVGCFREGLEGSQDYDLLLRILSRIEFSQIRHIPRILYHWRISNQSVAANIDKKPYAHDAGQRAIKDYLTTQNISATVEKYEDFGYKIKYPLPEPHPKIEFFIPSQYANGHIFKLVNALLENSAYNPSCIALHIALDHRDCDLLTNQIQGKYPDLEIKNYQPQDPLDINFNDWISTSSADFIGVINDHCIGFSEGWLARLLSFASQPGIGCVSPKIVDNYGSILSCGLILGKDWIAQDLFKGASVRPRNYYFGWSSLHKGFSVLPDQCVIFNRSHFIRSGGYNRELETRKIQHIDLCLKMKEAGLRNVLVPEAIVTLGQTMGSLRDLSAETLLNKGKDQQYVLRKWSGYFEHDPSFNPNLTLHKGKPVVAKIPRIDYPNKKHDSFI